MVYIYFQRLQRARKKADQRNLFLAQAEIRQTRTRRQTCRPDYVYYDMETSDVCFVFDLDWDIVKLSRHRMRRMANINIRRIIFLQTKTQSS